AEYYRQAAQEGYAPGQTNLAVLTLHGVGVEEDPRAAVEWLQKAADQDFPRALDLLGDCWMEGRGVDCVDTWRAAELYRRAAEQEYPPALCDLGLCYENANGVEEDKARAAALYRQAAELDYAPAMCNLAVCYLNG